ncbi:hypothetical protein BGAL_0276g00010 [Botrytis galanthina]|uniref:Uncharacterized protein n=1 Tax=Botrytis galanthina TaxID=278940 RepID=A0A4S8QRY5_9HELO|nr:hypothetical protein BGAL_0276g00010 [Botrytis galanthina]
MAVSANQGVVISTLKAEMESVSPQHLNLDIVGINLKMTTISSWFTFARMCRFCMTELDSELPEP